AISKCEHDEIGPPHDRIDGLIGALGLTGSEADEFRAAAHHAKARTQQDAAPYVEVGSEVGPDTVVCILEAMKVMNEIKAEARGVITAVVAENGKPVEFGQVLFKIRPL
ncbi:MAG: hypothetical protein EBU81_08245, partial [Proteobacteria bacterium]|nr:hypothetical protein [Pseudomonadota bacterium]